MELQVLVASSRMNSIDSLLKMNIQANTIVFNQGNSVFYQSKNINHHNYEFYSTRTIGVGVNRNLAIEISNADIILFSDDDLCYVDDLEDLVISAFERHPDADGIVFNLGSPGSGKPSLSEKKLHLFNSLGFGAPRLAVKKASIIRENIRFSDLFGGGCRYSSGEDSLFISEMFKAGLKLYSCPCVIATIVSSESTWFHGYNSKYYFDKGALFYSMFPIIFPFICIQDLLRHPFYKRCDLRFFQAFLLMINGARSFTKNKSFSDTYPLNC